MSNSQKPRTIYLLKRAEISLRNGLEAALKDIKITPGQYTVLSLLGSLPDASSAELARRAGVTPQTMSETISAFEKRGIISRQISAKHKRILSISLTKDGISLLSDCNKVVDTYEEKLFSAFDNSEIETLRTFLSHIIKSD